MAAWQVAVAAVAGLALVGSAAWAGISAFGDRGDNTPSGAPTTSAAPVSPTTDSSGTPDPSATPGPEPEPGPQTVGVDRTATPTTWRLGARDLAGKDVDGAVFSALAPVDPRVPLPSRTVLTASTGEVTYLAGVEIATGNVAWRREPDRPVHSCFLIDADRAGCSSWGADGTATISLLSLADGTVLGESPVDAYAVLGLAAHPDGVLVAGQKECEALLAVVPDAGGPALRSELTRIAGEDGCGSDMIGGIEVNDRLIHVGTYPGGVIADRNTLETLDVAFSHNAPLQLEGADGWTHDNGTSVILTTGAVDEVELSGARLSHHLCTTAPSFVAVGTQRVPLDGSPRTTLPPAAIEHDGITVAACDWGFVVDSQSSEMTTPSRVIDAAGTELWSADLHGAQTLVAGPDALVMWSWSKLIGVSTKDGTELWSVDVPDSSDPDGSMDAPRFLPIGQAVLMQGGSTIEALVFPAVP
ncbi:hypothetical protein IGS67_07150 [Flavimobilis sp. GY10621]|uniref:PQQ-like domain-containing protein n=1 Tax=Flavimobilis rhizosphaerae TaxID=2775421 RepID=A0ABR9DS93_9MICO|nr:hypothetical protein [Flavimobilis rhizosphaerae]MBD9699266.1 hypothetical protein [Flavimobilis rhizosphaerae]